MLKERPLPTSCVVTILLHARYRACSGCMARVVKVIDLARIPIQYISKVLVLLYAIDIILYSNTETMTRLTCG